MFVKLNSIPNFIQAETLAGLRRLMLDVNIRTGHYHQFFDIRQFESNGKLKWIAWYLEVDAKDEEVLTATDTDNEGE